MSNDPDDHTMRDRRIMGFISLGIRQAFCFMRLHFALELLAVAICASCDLATAQSAQNDHMIVPWRRIGAIELGMSAADLQRIMGEPTQKSRGAFVSVYNWGNDLSVFIKADGSSVTQICALNPIYTTAEGVHPGERDDAAIALLGQPYSSRVYRGWWKLSYTNLYWPGLTLSVPLIGFETNHFVRTVCVNHNSAIAF